MIPLAELCQGLDRLFPPAWAEPYDNVGLTIGDPAAACGGIMVALDVTAQTVSEALARGCNLLVTHHPFPWQAQKVFLLSNPNTALLALIIKSGLNLFAVHTNLDAAPNGHATAIAQALALSGIRPLAPKATAEPGVGLGRIGCLASTTAEALLPNVRRILRHDDLRLAGDKHAPLECVAVYPGAAGGMVETAWQAGARLLLGGEFSHHDAIEALARGMCLIEAGHYATEIASVSILADCCRKICGARQVQIHTATEQAPFATQ